VEHIKMFCSISGQIPQIPVVSVKTGHIYEKHLLEKYVKETGECPISGLSMTMDDIIVIEMKDPIVTPRLPTTTSVPNMMKLFQSEWDALMLESYSLKKQLHGVRQELEHAKLKYEAACRVISKLIKEKEESGQD
jgi:pre-mRNA-processing factor 19